MTVTNIETPLQICSNRFELEDAIAASSHRGPVKVECYSADPQALTQLENGNFSELTFENVSQFESDAIKVLRRLLSRQNVANPVFFSSSLMINSSGETTGDLLTLTPYSDSCVRIEYIDLREYDISYLANVSTSWFEIANCMIDETTVRAIARADTDALTIITCSEYVDQLLPIAESTTDRLEINIEGGISTSLSKALAKSYQSGLLCPSFGSDPAPLSALSKYKGALEIDTANINENLLRYIGDLRCSIFRTIETPTTEIARQLARMAATEIVIEEIDILTLSAACELARISERSSAEEPVMLVLDWHCEFEQGAEAELLKVAERHDRGSLWQRYWFPKRP